MLILTTFDDDASITAALAAGARGCLTKDASRADIARADIARADIARADIALAIRSGARGQSTFASSVTQRLVGHLGANPPTATPEPVAAAGD